MAAMKNSRTQLDEAPTRIVGQIRAVAPEEFLQKMGDRFRAMGVTLPYPKGVYRFKTFEEADEWAMKHRIAAAVKRLEAERNKRE
jgi:hypothetical protein